MRLSRCSERGWQHTLQTHHFRLVSFGLQALNSRRSVRWDHQADTRYSSIKVLKLVPSSELWYQKSLFVSRVVYPACSVPYTPARPYAQRLFRWRVSVTDTMISGRRAPNDLFDRPAGRHGRIRSSRPGPRRVAQGDRPRSADTRVGPRARAHRGRGEGTGGGG